MCFTYKVKASRVTGTLLRAISDALISFMKGGPALTDLSRKRPELQLHQFVLIT